VTFLAPIAGLIAGVLGGAVVVLVWMLKLRRRPVRVSTTMLWARAVRDMEGNVPWQMARPSVLLLLHLLVVALLALAIARPVREGAPAPGRGATLVIDAGASMRAAAAPTGETRLDRAKARAIGVIERAGSDAAVRVVRAGVSPSLVGSGGSARETAALVRAIEADDAPADLAGALALARTGRGGDEDGADPPPIVVLTDRADDPLLASGVSVVGVDPPEMDDGAARPGNIGITRVGARRDPTDPVLCRFFVRLDAAVPAPAGVVVRLDIGGETLASRAAELTPDEPTATITIATRLTRSALVRVAIDPGDALGTDDRAWVRVPDPSPIRVRVVAPGGRADDLLLDAIGAATRGPVEVVALGDASRAPAPDLFVLDRVAVDAPVTRGTPTIVFLGADGGEDDNTAVRIDRVRTWARTHPVMRDVELGGVAFERAQTLETDGGATRVLARSRAGAVMTESARGGVRRLRIGFALADSNWGVRVSFPIFMANAVERLVPGTRGEGIARRVGERVTLRAIGAPELAASPDPDARLVTMTDGRVELVGAHRSGVYEVRGADPDSVGLGVLDAGTTRRAGTAAPGGGAGAELDDARGVGSLGGGRVALWRWFALAAVFVLSIEWTLDVLRRRV